MFRSTRSEGVIAINCININIFKCCCTDQVNKKVVVNKNLKANQHFKLL